MNLKLDPEFARSINVLASRRKQLTQLGMGNKPNSTRPLEDVEVDKMYKSGYFGTHSPLVLQRTMWWKITNLFGHRAQDEVRKLKFGDITLCKDLSDRTYLEWEKECGSKTRTGELSYSPQRSFNPRAYEMKSERFPVKVYESFTSHRSEASRQYHSPFFLTNTPHHNSLAIKVNGIMIDCLGRI